MAKSEGARKKKVQVYPSALPQPHRGGCVAVRVVSRCAQVRGEGKAVTVLTKTNPRPNGKVRGEICILPCGSFVPSSAVGRGTSRAVFLVVPAGRGIGLIPAVSPVTRASGEPLSLSLSLSTKEPSKGATQNREKRRQGVTRQRAARSRTR